MRLVGDALAERKFLCVVELHIVLEVQFRRIEKVGE